MTHDCDSFCLAWFKHWISDLKLDLLFYIFASLLAAEEPVCPADTVKVGPFCLSVSLEAHSFIDAQIGCQSHGGNLVSVHNEDDWDELKGLLTLAYSLSGNSVFFLGKLDSGFVLLNLCMVSGPECQYSVANCMYMHSANSVECFSI